uniref:Secreted protein n=1 Tax=Anopheles darlingi TaxID=43151 RepID=A0A2M4D5N0_ANODA
MVGNWLGCFCFALPLCAFPFLHVAIDCRSVGMAHTWSLFRFDAVGGLAISCFLAILSPNSSSSFTRFPQAHFGSYTHSFEWWLAREFG